MREMASSSTRLAPGAVTGTSTSPVTSPVTSTSTHTATRRLLLGAVLAGAAALAGCAALRTVSSEVSSFGEWPDERVPAAHLVTLRQFSPQIRSVHDSDSQMNLQLAFLGFARDDRRFMALRFLRRILAGGN